MDLLGDNTAVVNLMMRHTSIIIVTLRFEAAGEEGVAVDIGVAVVVAEV